MPLASVAKLNNDNKHVSYDISQEVYTYVRLRAALTTRIFIARASERPRRCAKKGEKTRIRMVTTGVHVTDCYERSIRTRLDSTRLDGVCATRQLSRYFPRNKACVIDRWEKRMGDTFGRLNGFFTLRIILFRFPWYSSFLLSPQKN